MTFEQAWQRGVVGMVPHDPPTAFRPDMKTIAQTHPLIKELKHLQEENKRLKEEVADLKASLKAVLRSAMAKETYEDKNR